MRLLIINMGPYSFQSDADSLTPCESTSPVASLLAKVGLARGQSPQAEGFTAHAETSWRVPGPAG
jgi:hypothetical protein